MKPLLCTLSLLLLAAPAYAQGLSNSNKQPLEVSADGALEWQRGQNTFIARKNALAQQGDSSLAGDTLTATYIEDAKGKMQLQTITAQDNVILTSRDSKAYGDKAVYDLNEGKATMTGQNLKMITPEQTVTARDRFEYFTQTGRINAIGDATITRPKIGGGNDTLRAPTISAFLKKDANGKQTLDRATAQGGVTITTPTETITGQSGEYIATSNIATLNGNVKILRGPNTLEGERGQRWWWMRCLCFWGRRKFC